MFMDNVVSVYFSNVKIRGGGYTDSIDFLSEYGLSGALHFCGGKTAVGGSGSDKSGSADSLDFFTETELYKHERTLSFCLSGRRRASFLCLNEFLGCGIFPRASFRTRFGIPLKRRANAWRSFGIFPKEGLTLGGASGFSRKEI